jgi:16S rRNA G966 N2-methylase RsmD
MIQNYNNKRIVVEKLFPCPPNKNYNRLMIDNECVSFITTPINSELITTIIESLIPEHIPNSEITILDGTACVGGDSISFGKIFGTVIASEIDKKRYEMLVNNLKVFELHNVVAINDDSLTLCKKLNFIDIMYFDPPWGGHGYKDFSNIRLSIGNTYIDDLVNIILNDSRSNVKMIVFKLPKNYDLQQLYLATKRNNVVMILYELNKMFIIIFKHIDYV